jgi:hypothetical protein
MTFQIFAIFEGRHDYLRLDRQLFGVRGAWQGGDHVPKCLCRGAIALLNHLIGSLNWRRKLVNLSDEYAFYRVFHLAAQNGYNLYIAMAKGCSLRVIA